MLYSICFSGKTGAGGHIRSMRDISLWLRSNTQNVEILVLYWKTPLIFLDDIRYLKITDFAGLYSLLSAINSNKSNIVHFYDIESFSLLKLFTKCKVLLSRCGGVNPRHWPTNVNTVSFSLENHKFFSLSGRQSFLIPNRIYDFEVKYDLIETLKQRFSIDNKVNVVVRIGRISEYYENSFRQTLFLGRKLALENPVVVLMIGSIEDEVVMSSLSAAADSLTLNYNNLRYAIITEDVFTRDARALLPIATHVVGTGRSIMEACRFDVELFVPNLDGDLPIRVCEHNIEELQGQNFSGRFLNSQCYCSNKLNNEFYFKQLFELNERAYRKYKFAIEESRPQKYRLEYFLYFIRYFIVRLCR